jgi:hypothetical protein
MILNTASQNPHGWFSQFHPLLMILQAPNTENQIYVPGRCGFKKKYKEFVKK